MRNRVVFFTPGSGVVISALLARGLLLHVKGLIILLVRILLLGDNRSYHLLRFFESYRNKGMDVICGGFEEGDSFCEKFRERGISSFKYILSIPELKRVIKEFKPDVIHAHMAGNYGVMAMLSGLPYVLSLWGPDITDFPFKSPFKYLTIKKVLSRAILIHTDSYTIRWVLEKVFKVPPEKIVVFPFGISKCFFDTKWQKDKDEIVIMTHRKLEREYGHEVILKALKILKEEGFKFKCYIASFGSLREKLEELSKGLNLQNDVVFTGKLKEEELAILLSRAHIFVSAARTDTTPNSLLEAMTCGAFPVISDLPVYREWVHDGVNGLYFKMDSPEDLAEKIRFVIGNYEKFETKLKFNREIVEGYANWESNFENFHKLLKRVLEK
ncbi:MAG: glycosyltransferase family 4 protein [Candidatus Hydrothermia bacterium]